MKRIYDFITKANQVLLFLALLGAMIGIGIVIYHETVSHYEPPHVAVAQTPEEVKRTEVRDVRFLGETSGVCVFGIVKCEVAGPAGKGSGAHRR